LVLVHFLVLALLSLDKDPFYVLTNEKNRCIEFLRRRINTLDKH